MPVKNTRFVPRDKNNSCIDIIVAREVTLGIVNF